MNDELKAAADVWRIQVLHPLSGEWVTMKTRYRKCKTAQSWLSFVKSYWHGAPVRTIQEAKIRAALSSKGAERE